MSPLVEFASTIASALAVGIGAWLFSRISRARQAETQTETSNIVRLAISESEGRIKAHADQQFSNINQRMDELGRSVQAIDAREAQTRTMLAELKGRFDERTRGDLT